MFTIIYRSGESIGHEEAATAAETLAEYLELAAALPDLMLVFDDDGRRLSFDTLYRMVHRDTPPVGATGDGAALSPH